MLNRSVSNRRELERSMGAAEIRNLVLLQIILQASARLDSLEGQGFIHVTDASSEISSAACDLTTAQRMTPLAQCLHFCFLASDLSGWD